MKLHHSLSEDDIKEAIVFFLGAQGVAVDKVDITVSAVGDCFDRSAGHRITATAISDSTARLPAKAAPAIGTVSICRTCDKGIQWLGERWHHADGKTYRHACEPAPSPPPRLGRKGGSQP